MPFAESKIILLGPEIWLDAVVPGLIGGNLSATDGVGSGDSVSSSARTVSGSCDIVCHLTVATSRQGRR